jgi:hypothetical protein
LKEKSKLKEYLLLVRHHDDKPLAKLWVCDMEGIIWQLKLSQEYFEALKKALNLSCTLKTFIEHFLKSL